MKKFLTNLAMLRNVLFHSLLIFVTFFSFIGKGWGQTTTQTYSYTGSNQTFNVPAGVTSVTVYLHGGGGAGGSCGNGSSTTSNAGGVPAEIFHPKYYP